MSLHLFSLSDEEVFKRNATLLMLAFSRPMDDPNHMPATRDLSESKTPGGAGLAGSVHP